MKQAPPVVSEDLDFTLHSDAPLLLGVQLATPVSCTENEAGTSRLSGDFMSK